MPNRNCLLSGVASDPILRFLTFDSLKNSGFIFIFLTVKNVGVYSHFVVICADRLAATLKKR